MKEAYPPTILVPVACSVDLMLEEPDRRIKRLRIVEKARTLNFIYNLYDFEHDSSSLRKGFCMTWNHNACNFFSFIAKIYECVKKVKGNLFRWVDEWVRCKWTQKC